jgi:hypothetical protein
MPDPLAAIFDVLPIRHDYGDHRGCPESLCDIAATLHPEAIRIGMAALADAPDDDHAVCCVLCAAEGEAVAVIATGRGGWRVTGLRNSHVRRHGLYRDSDPAGPDYTTWKSVVFLVNENRVR